MVLYKACSYNGDIGPIEERDPGWYHNSVCECRLDRLRERTRLKIALSAQTRRFLPDDLIQLICQKINSKDAPATQSVTIDVKYNLLSFSQDLFTGTAPLCHCMQADLSLFKKHRCSFYVYGPIKLVMLVLGVVGSGCVHTDMLPMLFENGTLAKFSVIELRSYNYAFMAQEADSLIQCNIRHFLPMIMDDFTHLSKYVDIVYYKAHVLELIGTNDLHQKE